MGIRTRNCKGCKAKPDESLSGTCKLGYIYSVSRGASEPSKNRGSCSRKCRTHGEVMHELIVNRLCKEGE